ncbi:MAG: Uma2 family endonuclease [Isosphaeraceae bacterium]
MATVETETRVAPGESRVVIRDVGWQGYETLLNLVGDQPVRITYDRGDVELMSPLSRHERSKSRLGRMVGMLTEELEIDMIAVGSTTLKREDIGKGLEADESFYLASLSLIKDIEHLDMDVDPPPDLATEIETTRSALDRLGVYGALRVPEIWRFDGRRLRILVLQGDGTYREVRQSPTLPWISIEELEHFIHLEPASDTLWAKTFRKWVRETVLPRFRAERGGE